MVVRYVIIGSGIASLSAAEAIRQRDSTGRITIISEENHDFYSRPGLAYFLRRDIPEKQLFIRSAKEIRELALERIHSQALHIEVQQHQVHLENGQMVPYDRLLLATGALASPPTFTGNHLRGILKLDGLDDTYQLISRARKAKRAVVVGGGITALELAEGLHARGVKVSYLLRGDRYWSDVLNEEESKIVMDRLKHEGIDLRIKTQVEEAIGSRGEIQSVRTNQNEILPTQLLAVAIGVKPRIDLAQRSGLATKRGILVTPYLQTSARDIFAAGDCAEILDPQTGKSQQDILWPIALAQGRIAGANMAGEELVYKKEIPFNVTMLAGLKVAIIGQIGGGSQNDDLVSVSRGESETWRLLPKTILVESLDQVNRIRLAFGEKSLQGALVMGDQRWVRVLKKLILHQVDVSAIREALTNNLYQILPRLEQKLNEWEQRNKT